MFFSLGIEKHDGKSPEGATCPFNDQYIMASNPTDLTPANFDNAFRFSTCSINQLKGYLLNSTRLVDKLIREITVTTIMSTEFEIVKTRNLLRVPPTILDRLLQVSLLANE